MIKKVKPKASTENEVREFWDTHSSADYVDWSKAKRVRLPKLKRSHFIPLTVSAKTYEELNQVAKQEDRSLVQVAKRYVQEGLKHANIRRAAN